MTNQNNVELIGYYGSDETHACSAWTSTSRDLTKDKRDRIPKMLKTLAENGHHTPFEKSSLHFLVNSDIASHIHILKHRIGVSVNGESARYKEIKEDKFLIPDDWAGIKRKNKCLDKNANCIDDWSEILKDYVERGNDLYHNAVIDLESKLGRKRAKESARFFKTYNSQIESDVMFNFRSFVHFQNLRNHPDAQKEIRGIAQKMLDLVKQIEGNPFKHTIEAFGL